MTERQIWDYFRAAGLSEAGVAGLMGNLYHESGLRFNNLQNSYEVLFGMNDDQYTIACDGGVHDFVHDSAGYGIAQWTYWSRKQNLLNYARSLNVSLADPKMQLDFLMQELLTGYKSVYNDLTETNNVREASNAVMLQFERPADQSAAALEKRYQTSQGFYDRLSSGGEKKTMSYDTGNSYIDLGDFQFQNPIVNNIQFAKTALYIVKNYKTYYVNGCFGAPMTAANKARYTQNTQYNRQHAVQINALSPDTFGFDCVCLLKGILWGWNGNLNAPYGGANYGSNGVSDIGENSMINFCRDVSTDFSNVVVGEMLWMSGHAGIYIGDGLAVECTPSWKNGVQITAVGNIGVKSGYNTRKWVKHGKLPYFSYLSNNAPTVPASSENVNDLSKYTDEQLADLAIDGKFGTGDTRKKLLGDRYRAVQDIINARCKPQETKGIVYTVSVGDTLSSIAKKYNTTVENIIRDNPQITNPNLIYPGQRIGITV